eukprot:scaffold19029_cov119-Isochrysis_galbana.AAC.4
MVSFLGSRASSRALAATLHTTRSTWRVVALARARVGVGTVGRRHSTTARPRLSDYRLLDYSRVVPLAVRECVRVVKGEGDYRL